MLRLLPDHFVVFLQPDPRSDAVTRCGAAHIDLVSTTAHRVIADDRTDTSGHTDAVVIVGRSR